MQHFKYGKKETDYLKTRDKNLGEEIDKIGFIKREVNPDVFGSLISNIIGQQISFRAANTVTERVAKMLGEFSPENIYKASVEDIQLCGMSKRKAEYIKGIADAVINNTIDLDSLHKSSDEAIVKELIKLKGVGEWTAEMMLIHTFERPNVVSYKDLAIRRGIMRLHSLEEEISKQEFDVYKERYSPYGTVASIYLWEIARD